MTMRPLNNILFARKLTSQIDTHGDGAGHFSAKTSREFRMILFKLTFFKLNQTKELMTAVGSYHGFCSRHACDESFVITIDKHFIL